MYIGRDSLFTVSEEFLFKTKNEKRQWEGDHCDSEEAVRDYLSDDEERLDL